MGEIEPVIQPAVEKVEEQTVSKRTFFQRIFIVKNFLVLIGFGFIILAVFARNYPYFPFDLAITRAIQRITIPYFDILMYILTALGDALEATISIIFIIFLLVVLKRYRAALSLLISSFGASAIGIFLKYLVARPRPAGSLIHQLNTFVKPDSFPSGHVLHYMGFYGFLAIFLFTRFKSSYVRSLLMVILFILLVGIGFSRIYVGAHWFSDVLGSYLVGSVWLYFVSKFYNHLEKKKST